jgi:hypothetical protein
MRLLMMLASVMTAAIAGMPAAQSPSTLEAACERSGSAVGALVVRVPWQTAHAGPGAEVQFCVLRGAADAPLAFERNAEIVHFVVLGTASDVPSRRYTFQVRTTAGRTIEQGPVMIEPGQGFRRGCRADVCQFITEPNEFVASVAVRVE